jgi:hypothetical protein
MTRRATQKFLLLRHWQIVFACRDIRRGECHNSYLLLYFVSKTKILGFFTEIEDFIFFI